MDKYAMLRLENQLCFPLYASAKEITRKYKPFLDPLGLTYTQYIVMMVLWERRALRVSELGSRLWLDSGTLTPLLKKLEAAGYVSRARDSGDERGVIVSLTDAGLALRDAAAAVPAAVGSCIPLDAGEAQTLYSLLYKILGEI